MLARSLLGADSGDVREHRGDSVWFRAVHLGGRRTAVSTTPAPLP